MSGEAKVLIVDDYRISREFFEMYVKTSKSYVVVGTLISAQDAVSFCDNNAVDLIIMDVMMRSGIDGLSAAEIIKKKHTEIKIIIVTSTAESSWEERAAAAGIEGFWYKEYSRESLLEVMDRVLKGETVYPQETLSVKFGKASREDLTNRELEVLRELSGGFTDEVIAERLNISVPTVRFHIQKLLEKTGYKSKMELAMNAREIGFVVNDDYRQSGGNQ